LQFFAGLRPGEARGVCWEHYDGKRLDVRQSVWHTHVTSPKTEDSEKFVPVIEPLAEILADLREADGNPAAGPILRGPSGKPLNLDNLGKRVLIPLLKAKKVEWHGWYSLRRGVATTIEGFREIGSPRRAYCGIQVSRLQRSTTSKKCLKIRFRRCAPYTPVAMGSKPSWMQDPSNPLGVHVDLDALRARLQNMSNTDLLAFGRQTRSLVYPLTYDGDGNPSISAFSIQLAEARAEWRRRTPKNA